MSTDAQNTNNTSGKEVMIRVEGLKKKYRLGKIGARTLQGAIKDWRASRKKKDPSKESSAPKYNRDFYALNGVDLTVYKGETLGILGKNGAGKSTLLKILCRITAPTEGTVDLYGHITSMLEVGTGFHGEMTGRENIYLNGTILGMTKSEIDAKIDDIIAFSGLEEFIDTPVKRYSSGMFVKLGFSVAYHLDSEIVIMDEVLAVGDVEFQKKCINCLLEAANNDTRTVLYVSHNMNTIRQLCKRCIVLDKGEVIFNGDVDQAIAIYLGAQDVMPAEITFGPEHRPKDYQRLRARDLFSLDSLRLLNRPEPVFPTSGSAEIELSCTAAKPIRNVGFRFQLWYQDGTKIASSLPGNLVDVQEGTNRIKLTLPLAHLTYGRYSADIIVYQLDAGGIERKMDAVSPGFSFQIESAHDKDDYTKWDHQKMGAVRLSDNTVELLFDN
ncbi:MAG: ABC transporter ATP-binding protein [Clostridiales bacterium]|nr:ABC transporter ATP-binding protein [Clostridiales bacterium]